MKENNALLAVAEPHRVLVPQRRPLLPIFTSTAVFILFFACSIALYSVLPHAIRDGGLPLASSRLSLLSAVPTTAKGVWQLLLSATKSDAFFLSLSFLFSLSFFASTLINIALAARALQIGALVCRTTDWISIGVLSPALGVALLVCEAAFSAVLIVFASRSVSVSKQFRNSGDCGALPMIITLFLHLFYLLFSCFLTLFTAGILFFIAQL